MPAIALGLIAALYIPHSNDKLGARKEHSAVGKFAERWLIFDDPSLLRLGNISQSTMYSKSQKLQIIERAHYLHL